MISSIESNQNSSRLSVDRLSCKEFPDVEGKVEWDYEEESKPDMTDDNLPEEFQIRKQSKSKTKF